MWTGRWRVRILSGLGESSQPWLAPIETKLGMSNRPLLSVIYSTPTNSVESSFNVLTDCMCIVFFYNGSHFTLVLRALWKGWDSTTKLHPLVFEGVTAVTWQTPQMLQLPGLFKTRMMKTVSVVCGPVKKSQTEMDHHSIIRCHRHPHLSLRKTKNQKPKLSRLLWRFLPYHALMMTPASSDCAHRGLWSALWRGRSFRMAQRLS